MRIVLIALHFAEYSYRLATALASNNEVLLIVERISFERELGTTPPQTVRGLTFHYVQHGRSPLSVVGNARSIRSAVKAFQPDVVHIQEVIWDYLLFVLPALKRFPIVLTIHDPAPHSGETRLSGLRKRYYLYRWLIRRSCDAVIAHGDFLSAEVERLYPRLRGRVFSIPHGPLATMDETPSFCWEQGSLLFFGRIHAYKGLVYFIEAVERVAASGIAVKGIIAGRGAELDFYRKRLSNSPLFEVIEGFIPSEDIPNLFHRTQIVVLPYTDGTQSGVAALAMGYARPVIASKVGSIPELVQQGNTGLLTGARSVDDLVTAITDLVQKPELCRKMGMNGWVRCKSELSWDTIGKLTHAAYSMVSQTDI